MKVGNLEEILTQVKAVDHPVVIAGDMNTSGTDSVPTSFSKGSKEAARGIVPSGAPILRHQNYRHLNGRLKFMLCFMRVS
jgi:hypothetical protein